MLGYLILLFTLVPVVELALLIRLGQHIGVSSTLAVVIFTGIAGAYLARSQGLAVLGRIQEDVNKGIMPADKIFDGALVLGGGILLLTPGLITDFMGFMALLPFTRRLIKLWLKRKAGNMIAQGKVINITSSGKKWD